MLEKFWLLSRVGEILKPGRTELIDFGRGRLRPQQLLLYSTLQRALFTTAGYVAGASSRCFRGFYFRRKASRLADQRRSCRMRNAV